MTVAFQEVPVVRSPRIVHRLYCTSVVLRRILHALLFGAVLVAAVGFPLSARSADSAYRTSNVFIVSISGLRASEAFDAPNPAQYVPNLNRLRADGTLYREFYNLGATWTSAGSYAIAEGNWDLTGDTCFYYRNLYPRSPTMFEYYRKARPDVPANKVWVIVSSEDTEIVDHSTHPLYGEDYAASVDTSYAWRADQVTYDRVIEKMQRHHPSLVYVQFNDVELKASQGWSMYLSAIAKADALVGQLWDAIQADPLYRDQTTLIVTTDHGRHDDEHGGFRNSGCTCEGCKRLFLLALGPDTPAGVEVTTFRQLIDICPTVGELLGLDTPFSEGQVLHEMLAAAPARQAPSARAAWTNVTRLTNAGAVRKPQVAVEGGTVHVVWQDNRPDAPGIYYRQRPAGQSDWLLEERISDGQGIARAPSLVVDHNGAHVAWHDYRQGGWTVQVRSRRSDGVWTAAETVAVSRTTGGTGGELVWEPAIASVQGDLVVAVPVARYWLRTYRRSATGAWVASTVVDSSQRQIIDDRIALPQSPRMVSSGASLQLLWGEIHKHNWVLRLSSTEDLGQSWKKAPAVSPPTVEWGTQDAGLAIDGPNLYAAWIQVLNQTWKTPPFGLQENASSNRGGTWPTPATLVDHGTRHPRVAAAGGIVALAYEDMSGGGPAVYWRRSADRGVTWSAPELFSPEGQWAVEPEVAMDGDRTYVVFRGLSDGAWQVYLAEASDTEPTPTPSPTATNTSTPTATLTPTLTPTVAPPTHRALLPVILR